MGSACSGNTSPAGPQVARPASLRSAAVPSPVLPGLLPRPSSQKRTPEPPKQKCSAHILSTDSAKGFGTGTRSHQTGRSHSRGPADGRVASFARHGVQIEKTASMEYVVCSVAGCGLPGHQDGPRRVCKMNCPSGMCSHACRLWQGCVGLKGAAWQVWRWIRMMASGSPIARCAAALVRVRLPPCCRSQRVPGYQDRALPHANRQLRKG